MGRWRDTENDLPLDATGRLTGTDADGAFDGVAALARRLAGSAQVRACYTRKAFHNAHGRPPGTGDVCSVDQLGRAFASRLQDLIVALTQTDAFLYRQVAR